MRLNPKVIRSGMVMGGAVLTKGFLIAGGYYIGIWLDRKFQSHPWCMMIGIISGIILGLVWLVKVAERERL